MPMPARELYQLGAGTEARGGSLAGQFHVPIRHRGRFLLHHEVSHQESARVSLSPRRKRSVESSTDAEGTFILGSNSENGIGRATNASTREARSCSTDCTDPTDCIALPAPTIENIVTEQSLPSIPVSASTNQGSSSPQKSSGILKQGTSFPPRTRLSQDSSNVTRSTEACTDAEAVSPASVRRGPFGSGAVPRTIMPYSPSFLLALSPTEPSHAGVRCSSGNPGDVSVESSSPVLPLSGADNDSARVSRSNMNVRSSLVGGQRRNFWCNRADEGKNRGHRVGLSSIGYYSVGGGAQRDNSADVPNNMLDLEEGVPESLGAVQFRYPSTRRSPPRWSVSPARGRSTQVAKSLHQYHAPVCQVTRVELDSVDPGPVLRSGALSADCWSARSRDVVDEKGRGSIHLRRQVFPTGTQIFSPLTAGVDGTASRMEMQRTVVGDRHTPKMDDISHVGANKTAVDNSTHQRVVGGTSPKIHAPMQIRRILNAPLSGMTKELRHTQGIRHKMYAGSRVAAALPPPRSTVVDKISVDAFCSSPGRGISPRRCNSRLDRSSQ